MRERIAKRIADNLYQHPGLIALIMMILVGLSAWQMSKLTINYNQLELIPQDLPSVLATKRMFKLAGGYGNLFITLRSKDVLQMKGVADDLTAEIKKLPDVRSATCRQDVSFLRDHLAYYINIDDLNEAFRLMRKKIRTLTREKLGVKIGDTETDEELKKLVEKYRNVHSKFVDDEYNIDPAREMILIVIQANGIPNDLDFSKKLLSDVSSVIAQYNERNPRGATLKEEGGGAPAPEGTITYGMTGEYKITYDDSTHMKNALKPTSIVAFAGILLYLIILFRRPVQILLLMTTLVMSIVMTFGFTKITLGELNTITAILGGILMGFGIDFGIHFMYRFRDEYSHRGDIYESLRQTILHTGLSSLISVATSSASLFVLVLARFKGFSHFGLIAGAGMLIIAIMMYTFLPVAILLLSRTWPRFTKSLVVNYNRIDDADHLNKPFPFASAILAASLILTIGLAYFATRIEFDYDSRTSVTGDTQALVLQDEIEKRFGRKGLPSVVYTDTLEETKNLYEELSNKDKYSYVQQVVSIFSLAPPMEQQLKTREILDQIQERLVEIPAHLMTGENREIFDAVKKSLAAQPFTLKDVPEDLLKQFRPVPESGEKGYFTLIVPKGSVTDSKLTVEFAKQVGTIAIGGRSYYATGHMILMANLAMIVIRDGKIFPALAAVMILIILLISYRDPRALIFAMTPLLGAMVWMLGFMHLFNWKINYANIVVFPVVLGYGISSGIFIFNRYLETRSVMFALRHTGAAVAGSCLTTVIGWASLFFSRHKGLTSMGSLAVFGVSAALLVALTVMPSLMQYTENKKIFIPKSKV
ncbi:MAG TPA: MMPL family transporter [Thermodesulfobacteriota bacterium]|nr:MMPL family transporter [Thermodesulfobacteriota bacterium]